jgi:small subunit ribosomal protein S9
MAETTETVKDLKDLGAATGAEKAVETPAAPTEENKPKEPKLDAQGRAYATGRRKDAVARVWIKKGKGAVIVNGKPQDQYFGRQTHLLVLNQPFLIAGRVGQFDVVCTVKGGGLSGQAGAVRHGISRALENFEPELRPALKKAGMITRDARAVERKKVGKHKASHASSFWRPPALLRCNPPVRSRAF